MAACAPAAPAADKLVIHDKYLVGKKCDQRLLWERSSGYVYIYIYACVFVYVCKGISYQGRISVGRILPGQIKIPGYHPVGSFTR